MDLDLGAAAERLLGPTFAAQGMSVDEYSERAVTFRDERRIVRLSFNREDPEPWLSVVLGLRSDQGDLTVALWRLYPDEPGLAGLAAGAFDSPASLDARLVTLRDAWLDAYVWPAFAHPERFRLAWLAQQDEGERRYEADVREQRLTQARWAYEHGDLERAVEQFTLAGVDELSAADRRRFVMARRGVRPAT